MGNAFTFIIVGRGGRGGGAARMYFHFVKSPSFFCDTCVKRSPPTFSIASVCRSATWLMWRRPFVPFVPICKRVQSDMWFALSRMNLNLPNDLHFISDVFFLCSLFRQTVRWMRYAYLACQCRLRQQALRFRGHIHSSEHYSKRRNALLSRLLVAVFAMLCWCTVGRKVYSLVRSRSIAEAVPCTQSGSHGGHKVVMVGMRPFIVRTSWTVIPSACPAASAAVRIGTLRQSLALQLRCAAHVVRVQQVARKVQREVFVMMCRVNNRTWASMCP